MKADGLVKVQCITNKHNYYVEEDCIPWDAVAKDVFPGFCPICGCKDAVIAEETKKQK